MLDKLVQSTISSLGYLEKGVYHKEPDCFESIRDLIRLLHGDDARLTVRRICSVQNIVKNDLVPIMRMDNTSEELFDAALRLTVNLCQPTIIAFNGKLPENNDQWHIFYEAERNLSEFILSFVDAKIFDVLSQKCTDYFDLKWEDRTEKQKLIIERIFVLLRYIFAIGIENTCRTDISELKIGARNKMILNVFCSKFGPLFMRLCKDAMEREFCLHILAILSLAFKGINTNMLFMDPQEIAEKKKRETEELLTNLINVRKKEENVIRSNSKRNFLKGTFVVSGVKAPSSTKDLIIQKTNVIDERNPIARLTSRKKRRSLPARQRVANFDYDTTDLDEKLLAVLRQFCHEMLDAGAFNKLMRSTKELAFSNNRSLTHKNSEIYYYSLANFILHFARLAKVSCTKISATFATEFFHEIVTHITLYLDNIHADKHNIRSHSLKLQYAIGVYKEMLITINAITTTNDEADKELSKTFCEYIFQLEEFRDLGPSLMNALKPSALTNRMLQDLLLANHYYIHIMEKVLQSGTLAKVHKNVRVVKRRKRETKKQENETKNENAELKSEEQMIKEPSYADLESVWITIEAELGDVLSGKISSNEEISPINILLKVDDEEHQKFASLQIQEALRGQRVCDAVGMYRAARALWPDANIFGDDTMTYVEESNELRELFFLNLSEVAVFYRKCMHEAYGGGIDSAPAVLSLTDENGDKGVLAHEKDGEGFSDEENASEDEEETKYNSIEIPLDFDVYVMSFAKPNVIYWYVFQLKSFERNSPELNKAILKIMHRIAFDLKSPSFFYSATLFCVFRRVNDILRRLPRECRKSHKFYEIYLFGFHLLRKFAEHFSERGAIMACELLFMKTAHEAYDIEHGYGTYENQKALKGVLWTEDLEDELKNLYYEFMDLDEKPDNMDIVDFIEHNLSKKVSRPQVVRKMKEICGYSSKKKRKSVSKTSALTPLATL